MTDHPFIDAFAHSAGGYRPDVLGGYDPKKHHIVVVIGDRIVGAISPAADGCMEMAYAYDYRGASRGRDGVTPIGPTFDPEGIKRRLISVMFNGDRSAFEQASLKRRLK